VPDSAVQPLRAIRDREIADDEMLIDLEDAQQS
jgi:hypothetical protein